MKELEDRFSITVMTFQIRLRVVKEDAAVTGNLYTDKYIIFPSWMVSGP